MCAHIHAYRERWPIAGGFSIARGRKEAAEVVVAEVTAGALTGRGEGLPYPRYGQTPDGSVHEIKRFESMRGSDAVTGHELAHKMAPGAARNALDCALWDLQAQQEDQSVWRLAGLPPPRPVSTAYTISLDTPEHMQAAAEANQHRPLLKVKLGWRDDDAQRLRAVRRGAPNARLIVDANEGWSFDALRVMAPVAADVGVELIEQPLPADADAVLANYRSPVALGADESMTAQAPLTELASRYQVVNLKLDKTGGLTQAIATKREAEALGLGVMIGCMVATSLAMAPALLLATDAPFVDLDGPLLLAEDRQPGLVYDESLVSFPSDPFWGNVQCSE